MTRYCIFLFVFSFLFVSFSVSETEVPQENVIATEPTEPKIETQIVEPTTTKSENIESVQSQNDGGNQPENKVEEGKGAEEETTQGQEDTTGKNNEENEKNEEKTTTEENEKVKNENENEEVESKTETSEESNKEESTTEKNKEAKEEDEDEEKEKTNKKNKGETSEAPKFLVSHNSGVYTLEIAENAQFRVKKDSQEFLFELNLGGRWPEEDD